MHGVGQRAATHTRLRSYDDLTLGEGLCIGRDGGQPVTSDYESPFEFTGGVIKQVTIDVSDEAYRDLEKELAGAFARATDVGRSILLQRVGRPSG